MSDLDARVAALMDMADRFADERGESTRPVDSQIYRNYLEQAIRAELQKPALHEPVTDAKWHTPGIGEVHSSDHKQMIYCEAMNSDGEMVVSDTLAEKIAAALQANAAAIKGPVNLQDLCNSQRDTINALVQELRKYEQADAAAPVPARAQGVTDLVTNLRDVLALSGDWADPDHDDDETPFPSLQVSRAIKAADDFLATPPNATKGDEAHPENRCEHCYGPNITWFAPNDLWNAYAGNSDIICPICFVTAAEAAGFVPTAWVVTPETFGSKPTKGDEVSDAERYRWLQKNWFEFGGMHNVNTPLGASLHKIGQAGDIESLDAAIDAAIRAAQKG